MIPRIIHQTWKSADVPDRWRAWSDSWRRQHPDWDYRLWTDDDNRALVATYYPSALALYDGYSDHINRVDAARFFLLHHYGGLYVDLDFECLRPIGPLTAGAEVVLGLEPEPHVHTDGYAGQLGLTRIVCNAFMASTPRHPFWDHCIAHLHDGSIGGGVLGVAGGFFLTKACDTFAEPERLRILPAATIYPITKDEAWREREQPIQAERHAGAYAVHHWTGSWWRDAMMRSVRDRLRSQRGGA